jgi:hypothetical protein
VEDFNEDAQREVFFPILDKSQPRSEACFVIVNFMNIFERLNSCSGLPNIPGAAVA